MSQRNTPSSPQSEAPDSRENTSSPGYEPPEAMKERNRRFGLIFLGVVAFLVALTVITRIILSS